MKTVAPILDPSPETVDSVVEAQSVSLPADGALPLKDWRRLSNGRRIPAENYADQPYLLVADDGALLCVITTGPGAEGAAGQHVAVLRSEDKGHTWTEPLPLEALSAPESSYGVLLKVASGRIYCFYNFNADNLRQVETLLPEAPLSTRVDTLGEYVFRYSDDHGRSWSEKSYEVPIRETEIDRQNITRGRVRFMWNVGRPFTLKGAVYLSIHKVGNFGKGFMACSEGWLIRSSNLWTESDVELLQWETLPEGERGICAPDGGGPVADEQDYTVLSDGSICCTFRTLDGYPAETYSRDGGRTWSPSVYRRYADGRLVKHPRAANFVWDLGDNKYLYWFHNHGGPFLNECEPDAPMVNPYFDRNPAWVCAGKEVDGPEGRMLSWSQPEILLYDDDPLVRISYPDLVQVGGEILVSETQKHLARLHAIDPAFLNKLWDSSAVQDDSGKDILVQANGGGTHLPAPDLPAFLVRDISRSDHRAKRTRAGFTILFTMENSDLQEELLLLDNRTKSGIGWAVKVTAGGAIELYMSDGQTPVRVESEKRVLPPDGMHQVGIVVDGGPCIISFIVNDRFCDGGDQRQFGWQRFSPHLRNTNGSRVVRTHACIKGLRIYARALMTCEVIARLG